MEEMREEMYMSAVGEKDKEKEVNEATQDTAPPFAEVTIPGSVPTQHYQPNEIQNLNAGNVGVDEKNLPGSPSKPDVSKLRSKTFKKKAGGQMIEALSRLTDQQPESEKKIFDKLEAVGAQLQQGFGDIGEMKEMLEALAKDAGLVSGKI
ncbi:hypothetical protein CYMTET_20547 [Cymbomonas tetramitiformis]|uniref:Uncharacterized protein n=1 Tax=Cymbomonas tetramitiformis TaxID=36881 RepID=A0AAE0L3V7_9CHLO|nr:hypothetical protein CYMTET_20547 [Cymbomonas tetramitiformis]